MEKTAKIFLAGSNGLVGSALLRRLQAAGYSNLLTPEIDQLDLTDHAAVKAFFEREKPEYVILAAAKVGGIHANNTYPADFIYLNLCIQNNVIHQAYLNGVKRLLFLGSSCIYPKLAPQPMKEEHLLTGLLEPTNEPYAIAKIAGIKMCESYNRQYGTKFIAVMPTNLYGPRDNFDLANSHVLPAMIRKFHEAKIQRPTTDNGMTTEDGGRRTDNCLTTEDGGRRTENPLSSAVCPPSSVVCPQSSEVVIWGTGTPRREFLYVDDMADGCIHLLNLPDQVIAEKLLNYPEPCFVNLGTGVDVTIAELAEMVREVVGFTGSITYDSTKPDGTPRKLQDVTRMKALGWEAKVPLKEGIAMAYRWFLENQDRIRK